MKIFHAALLLLAARSAIVVSAEQSGDDASYFEPPVVNFGAFDLATLTRVQSILAEEGILAVANVPGLKAARQNALVAAAECVLMHGKTAAPVQVELQDTSTRASWAAYTSASGSFKPREGMPVTPKCDKLNARMDLLRDAVDEGASYFSRLLDVSVLVPEFDLGLADKAAGGAYHTFQEMLDGAQHLDHFHVYEKKSFAVNNKMALDLHTDHGLFIGIVPSVRVVSHAEGRIAVNKEEDSFEIETSNGERTKVKLPLEGDVLLFMIGDGSLNMKRATRGLRPVPHALALHSDGEPRSVRAWFGRMFFAPSDALLNENGDTFASAIETVITARRLGKEFPSLGCATEMGARRILHDPTGNNCSAGTAYCWMSCRPMGNLTCDRHDALCYSNRTGQLWVDCPTCHDSTARLVCPGDVTLATRSPTIGNTTATPAPSASAAALALTVANVGLMLLAAAMLM